MPFLRRDGAKHVVNNSTHLTVKRNVVWEAEKTWEKLHSVTKNRRELRVYTMCWPRSPYREYIVWTIRWDNIWERNEEQEVTATASDNFFQGYSRRILWDAGGRDRCVYEADPSRNIWFQRVQRGEKSIDNFVNVSDRVSSEKFNTVENTLS